MKEQNLNTATEEIVDVKYIETEMTKLVIDCYLQGARTREFPVGTLVGVNIYQGIKEEVLLFINGYHKITVELYQGKARVSAVKDIKDKDFNYILSFTKCLGISEFRSRKEINTVMYN